MEDEMCECGDLPADECMCDYFGLVDGDPFEDDGEG